MLALKPCSLLIAVCNPVVEGTGITVPSTCAVALHKLHPCVNYVNLMKILSERTGKNKGENTPPVLTPFFTVQAFNEVFLHFTLNRLISVIIYNIHKKKMLNTKVY